MTGDVHALREYPLGRRHPRFERTCLTTIFRRSTSSFPRLSKVRNMEESASLPPRFAGRAIGYVSFLLLGVAAGAAVMSRFREPPPDWTTIAFDIVILESKSELTDLKTPARLVFGGGRKSLAAMQNGWRVSEGSTLMTIGECPASYMSFLPSRILKERKSAPRRLDVFPMIYDDRVFASLTLYHSGGELTHQIEIGANETRALLLSKAPTAGECYYYALVRARPGDDPRVAARVLAAKGNLGLAK